MRNTILCGDVREQLRLLPDESVNCVVTSPPYWGLRDYGVEGQLGLEATPEEFVCNLVDVFREVRRVLRADGTVWLNLGDSYAGSWGAQGREGSMADRSIVSARQIAAHPHRKSHTGSIASGAGLKPKDMVGIPWRVAFALQADGWWLRSDIIWSKPNPMPESVQGTHYKRHRVTIGEYERLSGLRYTDERLGDDWAGDMPPLSEGEKPHRKAPLSAKREGQSDGASARGTRGRQGEAAPVLSIGKGPGEQRQVPSDGQGEGSRPEAVSESSSSRESGGGNRNGRGLAPDIGAASSPLLLLQEGASADDTRPCDSAEQGRPQLTGERSSGVRELQLREEGQDSAAPLVGCPGCPKCEMHHGYTFHLSAGRPTKSHEYISLLSKSATYYYDAEAIRESFADERMGNPGVYQKTSAGERKAVNDRQDLGFLNNGGGWNADGTRQGRNKRTVWEVATEPYAEAHFATFPTALVKPCILAGCPEGGIVLDPFFGSGTTGLVAKLAGRDYIGIELNPEYVELAKRRINVDQERML